MIETVAGETDTDPMELPRLYTVVDPDALDALFRSNSPTSKRDAGHVEFSLAGRRVVVEHDGTVEVADAGSTIPETATDVPQGAKTESPKSE